MIIFGGWKWFDFKEFCSMTGGVCNRKYAGRRIKWITPCKRSVARGNGNLSRPQPRSGLNSYGIPVWQGISSCPELRFACKGLSTFKTYGLVWRTPLIRQSPKLSCFVIARAKLEANQFMCFLVCFGLRPRNDEHKCC